MRTALARAANAVAGLARQAPSARAAERRKASAWPRSSRHNALDRRFTATRLNQRWVAGFTYIWPAEGWLYLAGVIDLFSRRVVGWAMKTE